ncbi:MAG: AI-2E family transporter [Paracoccaceae bacterium]
MTVGEQLRWWGLGLAVTLLLVWLLANPLLPFLLGAAIAYLADPLADRLERAGLSRMMATVALSVGIAGTLFGLATLLVPAVVGQIRSLIENAPSYLGAAQDLVGAYVPEVRRDDALFDQLAQTVRERAKDWSMSALDTLWTGSLAVVDFLSLAVITPVVGFYMLYDWDNMIGTLDELVPRQHRATIRRLAIELDDVLAGFVRGQLTVCTILGLFYAVALTIVGLNFGLIVGLFAGLISFIPFIGSIVGGAISIGIAIGQFWGDPVWIAIVAAIFVAGQAVEGNYLTPKLVGGHVKLHPVWLMLALSVGGYLMGFVGLLIAVPAAAAVGVLARFLVAQYKRGRLYRGVEVPGPAGAIAPGTALDAETAFVRGGPDDRADDRKTSDDGAAGGDRGAPDESA